VEKLVEAVHWNGVLGCGVGLDMRELCWIGAWIGSGGSAICENIESRTSSTSLQSNEHDEGLREGLSDHLVAEGESLTRRVLFTRQYWIMTSPQPNPCAGLTWRPPIDNISGVLV